MSARATPRLRCAIYTRKSSEEGLDQAFNSLDAQREAGEAYVKSQSAEGWKLIVTRYDDGGYSGGSMERPGLQRLLADVDAGKIDVVVVYKIDRLTRSLADFARIVERFDAKGVSFVSVTQSFNTTSSMGRLTLNVLLSFAQFEREVTGERIRDKIAASKAKGLWMGGVPPLGYDLPLPGERVLRVNEAEAATVRHIFARYLALGSVHRLAEELARDNIRSKRYLTRRGHWTGGAPFGRGQLYHLLKNRICLGEIRHRDVWHTGGHDAILDPATFDAAQAVLGHHTRRRASTAACCGTADLAGRLFDSAGQPMSPTHARGKSGKLYRYYVTSPLQRGARAVPATGQPRRISALALEQALASVLARLLPDAGMPLSIPTRIALHADRLTVTLPRALLTDSELRLAVGETLTADPGNRRQQLLTVPIHIAASKSTRITATADRPLRRDPVLIAALRRAHGMIGRDAYGPTLAAAPDTQYARRIAGLACLAPDLQRDILAGRQPATLCLEALIARDLPLDWAEQRNMLGWPLAGANPQQPMLRPPSRLGTNLSRK